MIFPIRDLKNFQKAIAISVSPKSTPFYLISEAIETR